MAIQPDQLVAVQVDDRLIEVSQFVKSAGFGQQVGVGLSQLEGERLDSIDVAARRKIISFGAAGVGAPIAASQGSKKGVDDEQDGGREQQPNASAKWDNQSGQFQFAGGGVSHFDLRDATSAGGSTSIRRTASRSVSYQGYSL